MSVWWSRLPAATLLVLILTAGVAGAQTIDTDEGSLFGSSDEQEESGEESPIDTSDLFGGEVLVTEPEAAGGPAVLPPAAVEIGGSYRFSLTGDVAWSSFEDSGGRTAGAGLAGRHRRPGRDRVPGRPAGGRLPRLRQGRPQLSVHDRRGLAAASRLRRHRQRQGAVLGLHARRRAVPPRRQAHDRLGRGLLLQPCRRAEPHLDRSRTIRKPSARGRCRCAPTCRSTFTTSIST